MPSLLKLVIGLLLAGLLLVEAASPFVANVQLDGTANTAAFEAALEFERSKDVEAAEAVAAAEAKEGGAVVEAFSVDGAGGVTATFRKDAFSVIFKKWDKTKSYYVVRTTKTSKR